MAIDPDSAAGLIALGVSGARAQQESKAPRGPTHVASGAAPSAGTLSQLLEHALIALLGFLQHMARRCS